MFDELDARTASADGPARIDDALALLGHAALSPLQVEAIKYYVSEGSAVPELGSLASASASIAFTLARYAITLARAPRESEAGSERRIFSDLMVSLAPSLGSEPQSLARRLTWVLTGRLTSARAFLERAAADPVSAWMASRDLFEAAGVGLLVSKLVAPVAANEAEDQRYIWVFVRFDAPPAAGAVGRIVSRHDTWDKAQGAKAARDQEVGPSYVVIPRPASEATQPLSPGSALTYETSDDSF